MSRTNIFILFTQHECGVKKNTKRLFPLFLLKSYVFVQVIEKLQFYCDFYSTACSLKTKTKKSKKLYNSIVSKSGRNVRNIVIKVQENYQNVSKFHQDLSKFCVVSFTLLIHRCSLLSALFIIPHIKKHEWNCLSGLVGSAQILIIRRMRAKRIQTRQFLEYHVIVFRAKMFSIFKPNQRYFLSFFLFCSCLQKNSTIVVSKKKIRVLCLIR